MSARLKTIGALLRKDLITLWPLVALASILWAAPVVMTLANMLVVAPFPWGAGLQIATYLSVSLLVVAVIQTDAPRRLRQDWLVRPIPYSTLLWAKGVFITTALAVPVAVGVVIVGVRDGTPIDEILWEATSINMWLVVGVTMLCVVAALTSSVIESVGTLVGICVLVGVVSVVDMNLHGPRGEGFSGGPIWILWLAHIVGVFTVAVAVAWLAYVRRAMAKAWAVFVGAVLLELAFTVRVVPVPSGVFAVQKMLSPDPAAAEGIRLAQVGDCFPAIRVDPGDSSGSEQERSDAVPLVRLAPSLWSNAERKNAGSNAIGFQTRVGIAGTPDGWRTVVDRVVATYVDADGQETRPLQVADRKAERSEKGVPMTSARFWLLPRVKYERLATADTKLHLDYSLTLMRSMATASLPIDGERRYVTGFGYCSAEVDPSTRFIDVNCFRRGSQAGQFSAATGGMEVFSRAPDYTPAFLQFLSGRRHAFKLLAGKDDAQQVTLTHYAAVAHFEREFVATGVLGGSAAACPAP